MKERLFPVLMVLLAAAWIFSSVFPPSRPAGDLQIDEFGRIPVVADGRVKPMDTVARTYVRLLSERESFRDESGKSHPAIDWLLDVEAGFSDKESRARKHPVFRITHPDLLNILGLQPREGFRYSIDDFGDKVPALVDSLKTAHERREKGLKLDAYEITRPRKQYPSSE